jgi:hypothetical protein
MTKLEELKAACDAAEVALDAAEAACEAALDDAYDARDAYRKELEKQND